MRVENFLCLERFSILGEERNQNETFYILRPVLGLAEKFLNRGKSSTRNETLLILTLESSQQINILFSTFLEK